MTGFDESKQSSEAARHVSRRRFMQAAGVAGGLAVGTPLLASARAQGATPAPGTMPGAAQPENSSLLTTSLPSNWDLEADVVVVGSGGAAFAAAATAHQAGADVLMLERATAAGGTTLISGSEYWIPNNSYMRAKGLEDPREWALKYMVRLSYPQLYDPDSPTLGAFQDDYDLIATYYDTGYKAIDAFEKWGALYSRIQPSFGYSDKPDLADPDYHADLPEDHAPYGRGLNPDPDKGGSTAVTVQMHNWTDKQGIPLKTSHRVVGAFQNGQGQIVGVQAENNGKLVSVRANKAVIFGSGGFTQDGEKSLNYLRGPIFGGCGVPTNTGDFVDIGLALGAKLGNMNHAFWVPSPLEHQLEHPSVTPGKEVWIPYGDSMVIVNKYGNRVASEKMVYNERTQTHFWWEPLPSDYKNLVQIMIWDSAVAQNPTEWNFRYPVPLPCEESELVISGDTWQELATNIEDRVDSLRGQGTVSSRVNPQVRLADNFTESLKSTIQRFNQFAEQGVDEDFGRGSTPIQVAWNGPAREGNTKNPTMYPFRDSGPYYAVLLGGGTLDTNGGPVINTNAQVVHSTGDVIPGLYGAGNCIASPAGQAYWSGGSTIGPGLVYGYIAGQHAAGEEDKPAE